MSPPQAVPFGAPIIEIIETANERLKRHFGAWFWGSMIVATFFHFGVFAFSPDLTTEDFSFNSEDIKIYDLPPEIEIPPPPQQIARPATPVIAATDIEEDITIAPTTFEDNPVEDLPPPPESNVVFDISKEPTFVARTIEPDILNRDEVSRVLEREYPQLLKDAGIGGTTRIYFLIGEDGQVRDIRIDQTSGHQALDEAALRVADIAQFSPAQNRDKKVAVWISMPILFRVR